MAISINWATKVITVPQADLTHLGGTNYELDINTFRLALKDIEDSDEGMAYPLTHNHVPPITVGGTALGRVVEIVNGYTITFQDVGSPYIVSLVGANSNISDVTNLNNVSIRSQNSGGLVLGSGGGAINYGLVAAAVWDEAIASHLASGSAGKFIADLGVEVEKRLKTSTYLGSK